MTFSCVSANRSIDDGRSDRDVSVGESVSSGQEETNRMKFLSSVADAIVNRSLIRM